MKVLVCNAGSTSLKFKLFNMPAEEVLAEGKVERVGTDTAIFHFPNRTVFASSRRISPPNPIQKAFSSFWTGFSIKRTGFWGICLSSHGWDSRRYSPGIITASTS